jgi:hypothetical protein
MVAGDKHYRNARLFEGEQRLEDDLLRLGGWREMLVDIAGDDDRVDLLVAGYRDDLAERRSCLVEARWARAASRLNADAFPGAAGAGPVTSRTPSESTMAMMRLRSCVIVRIWSAAT